MESQQAIGGHLLDANNRGHLFDARDDCRGPQQEHAMWHSEGQGYQTQGWGATKERAIEDDNNKTIGCMIPMSKRSRRTTTPDDSDVEEEHGEMVCNMTGQTCENLPFPIITDSGACASVMPTSWRSHVPLHETQQSKAGDYYKAANGSKIYHEGERVVSMMTQEGSMRDMRFTVCDVSKALGSMSQMCRTRHRIVFNPPWSEEGSFIEHADARERVWLQEEGGLYVLRTKVAPRHQQSGRMKSEDFTWPATPP